MSFEEKTKRLDDIVKKIEMNETTIDESLKLFEEGVTLAKELSKQLDEHKGKILEIKQTAGEFIETDM